MKLKTRLKLIINKIKIIWSEELVIIELKDDETGDTATVFTTSVQEAHRVKNILGGKLEFDKEQTIN